ncbi:MAG: hypothetical protein ACR2MQ_05035 [Gemmatimonadaceae bacterium]
MVRPIKPIRIRWIAPVVLLASLAACSKDSQPSTGQTSSATGNPATPQLADTMLTRQNAVLETQKDSLLGATRSLLAAMASIDSATTAAGIKAKDRGEPIATYEEGVRQRTVQALQRLRTTRARLNAISARVSSLGGENTALKGQLDTFRTTVAALQTQVVSQQARGDSLVRQLYYATVRGDSLEYRTKQLGYTIDSTGYENRRAFVVTGTADYLVKHGLVQNVGGTRFPFIARIGSTIRPTNSHPDTTLFKMFDRMAVQTIPVDSTRKHEIISSQDLSGADRSDAKGRVFSGAIHITDPKRFWRSSPYLILLEP